MVVEIGIVVAAVVVMTVTAMVVAVAVAVALVVCGHWMISEAVLFTHELFGKLPLLLDGS